MLKAHFNKMHNFWMPSGGAKCRERFQWAYINYIRTKDYVFMPALSKNADCIEDTTVRRQFELRFPEYPKEKIIPNMHLKPSNKKEDYIAVLGIFSNNITTHEAAYKP